MIAREDMDYIKSELDIRYVLREDCNERQTRINNMLANDDKRIDLILQNQANDRENFNNKIRFNNWLTTAVLLAIVGAIIAFYFAG